MSLSRVVALGDGVTNQFAVNFALGYISEADITCQVNNELDGFGDPVYRAITFITAGLLQIAGTIPANGVDVVFTRTVTETQLLVDWTDGAVINDDNMNLAQKQLIMLVHQVLDGRFSTFTTDLDMGGFQIKNVKDPTDPQDAVTQKWIQDNVTAVVGGAVISVNGQGGVVILTPADFSLGNVNNTSDANKPVSTAQQTALDLKAASVHTHLASQISDSTAYGRLVLQSSESAHRDAIYKISDNFEYATEARILSYNNFI
jgi:hypothetical protein